MNTDITYPLSTDTLSTTPWNTQEINPIQQGKEQML